jgi:hypothetical protein
MLFHPQSISGWVKAKRYPTITPFIAFPDSAKRLETVEDTPATLKIIIENIITDCYPLMLHSRTRGYEHPDGPTLRGNHEKKPL